MVSIGTAVMILTVATSALAQTSGGSTPDSQTPATTSSNYEELRDLVNRGIVPRQALEPARLTDEDQLRDLVNRGIIPPQALPD